MFNWIRKPAKESRTIPECRRTFEIHMQWPVIARHVKNRKRCRTATTGRRAVMGGHCKPHKCRTTRHIMCDPQPVQPVKSSGRAPTSFS